MSKIVVKKDLAISDVIVVYVVPAVEVLYSIAITQLFNDKELDINEPFLLELPNGTVTADLIKAGEYFVVEVATDYIKKYGEANLVGLLDYVWGEIKKLKLESIKH